MSFWCPKWTMASLTIVWSAVSFISYAYPEDNVITFSNVTTASGIYGTNVSRAAAWADFNNDGWPDLLTLSHIQELQGFISQLWMNKGDGSFSDVTRSSGLNPDHTDPHGAAWGDFDNDGDLDLYVTKGTTKPDPRNWHELWANRGNSTFVDITKKASVEAIGYPSKGGYWIDFNNDGRLDLFVAGRVVGNRGLGNILYRNDGEGRFTNVAEEVGLERRDQGNRTAQWADFNHDGRVDVFLTAFEDGIHCVLLSQNNNGLFVDVTVSAGFPDFECTSAAWGDYDNDGDLDIYIASDTGEDVLLRNDGDGTFTDVTQEAGVLKITPSRSAVWGDYDNDGNIDLYVVSLLNKTDKNLLYRNNGDGTFTDVTEKSDVDGKVEGGGVDATFVDYNNDGFLDIFVTNGSGNFGGPFILYRNNGENSNNWLKIKLQGTMSNRDGIGAKIMLHIAGKKMYREYHGPSHYHSQDRSPLHFGLGETRQVDKIAIRWPSGVRQTLSNIEANQTIKIIEGMERVHQENLAVINNGATGEAELSDFLAGSDFAVTHEVLTHERWPGISFDQVGSKGLLVWADHRNGRFDIYGQRISSSGDLMAASFPISDIFAREVEWQRTPRMIHDPVNSQYLVVWTRRRQKEGLDILGQFVTPHGETKGSNFPISGANGRNLNPALSLDPSSNRYLIVWEETRAGRIDIIGQLIGTDGRPIGTRFSLTSQAPNPWRFKPAVAHDPTNRTFLVVWEDWRNGPARLFGQFVDAEGTRRGGNFAIAQADGQQTSAALAFNPLEQTFLVVWQKGRPNGTSNIIGQLIGPDGRPIGTHFSLTSEATTSWQFTPAVAHDPTNRTFLVVWEDWRNGPADIFGQFVDAEGTRRGGNFAIARAKNWQWGPALSFSHENSSFLLVWQDSRGGTDFDIFGAVIQP